METIKILFPASYACQPTPQGAFFWFNIANIINVVCGLVFVLAFFVALFMIVAGVYLLGLTWLIFWIGYALWLPLDWLYLGLGLFGGQLHLRSCKEMSSLRSAITPARSIVGSNAISWINWMLHLGIWLLTLCCFIGFPFFIVPPIISFICLVTGFLGRHRED